MVNKKFASCPVCYSTNSKLLFKRKDLSFQVSSYEFSIVRCTSCGMAYVQDPPDEESLADFYPEEFYASNHRLYEKDETPLKRKLEFLNRRTAPLHISGNKLLDIGCGGGEFVEYVTQHGWQGYGYEYSTVPSFVSGAHIVQAKSLEGIFQPASFDVITAWAVLEHAHNLRDLMKEVSLLLKKGGIFISLVSNINSIPGRYMQQDDIPRHLNLFTRKSLSLLLHKNNLNPVHWDFYDNIYYSGTHRGFLVFLLKHICGESLNNIVEQHRAPGRRDEFCTMLHGKPSKIVDYCCMFDRSILTPVLDRIASFLGYGFTMTVTAHKK